MADSVEVPTVIDHQLKVPVTTRHNTEVLSARRREVVAHTHPGQQHLVDFHGPILSGSTGPVEPHQTDAGTGIVRS